MAALIHNVRVSKAGGSQVVDLQRDTLAKAGVDLKHHLCTDAASGKRDYRLGLNACIKALRHGDTLVVWKLGRLGCDLRHLVDLVGDLTKRGIGPKVFAGEDASIDTTTADGRPVFAIFAGLTDFERGVIAGRIKGGLDAARGRGRSGGRLFKLTPAKLRLTQASMSKPETKVVASCAELGITLHRFVGPKGQLHSDGQRRLKRRKVK